MLILGHRGTIGKRVSQNSLPAFAEALDVADGFETDACLTSDGALFLIHEANNEAGIAEHLDFGSSAKVRGKRLHRLTAAMVQSLRLKHGEPIPTLEHALDLVGQKTGKLINIELKGFGVAEPVLNILRDYLARGAIKLEAILVSSFHHDALRYVRRAMPELKLGALVVSDNENGKPLFSYHDEAEAKAARYIGLTEALASPIMREINPALFVMPEKLLTFATIEKIATPFPEAQLCGWTVTERHDYDAKDLLNRLTSLQPTGKIAAMIVDDPVAFSEAWMRR